MSERAHGFDLVALARYRELFPITRRYAYFNHAGIAPASTRVGEAIGAWLERLLERGALDKDDWEDEVEACRERVARLYGSSAGEITFVRNTSHGLSLVAFGLEWRRGDRVAVAADLEYPSNVYPWQRLAARGVALDRIAAERGAVEVEAAARALRKETRLLAVSSAQFSSGAVADLAALGQLCRERGVLFCVDGIQTVGALPLDVKAAGIHFLSADSHKWMLGVQGIGALFVDRDLLDQIDPLLIGWRSTTGKFDFDTARLELESDARKFEEGSLSYALIAGFDAAVVLLQEVGMEVVESRIGALIDRLARGLEALGADLLPDPRHRRHMLAFTHPALPGRQLLDDLTRRSIVCTLRRGRIRVAPHFYNSEEEIDRLVAAVAESFDGAGGSRARWSAPGRGTAIERSSRADDSTDS